MKRHPALRQLSSDHQQALVQARRLIKAAGLSNEEARPQAAKDEATELTEAAKVAPDFLAFWTGHTIRHFREEEEVLLPAFARYGDPSIEPIVRVLVEHVHIRRLVADLQQQVSRGQPSVDTMRAIGEMLRAHIRHEENVVFPLLEEAMPKEALAELLHRLAAFDDYHEGRRKEASA